MNKNCISIEDVLNLLHTLHIDNIAVNDKRITEYIKELPIYVCNVENKQNEESKQKKTSEFFWGTKIQAETEFELALFPSEELAKKFFWESRYINNPTYDKKTRANLFLKALSDAQCKRVIAFPEKEAETMTITMDNRVVTVALLYHTLSPVVKYN